MGEGGHPPGAVRSDQVDRPGSGARKAGLQGLQRWVGIAALVTFAGTGWFMQLHRPAMDDLPPGTRLQLRSGHLFLMFAGLLNLTVSMAPLPVARRWRRPAIAGRLLAILGAVQLAAGFFLESDRGLLDRPLTTTAVIEIFAGTLLHLLAAWQSGKSGAEPASRSFTASAAGGQPG